MFCDNDLSKADKICDPDIKVHNLLVSEQTDGLDAWKKNLGEIFKGILTFPINSTACMVSPLLFNAILLYCHMRQKSRIDACHAESWLGPIQST